MVLLTTHHGRNLVTLFGDPKIGSSADLETFLKKLSDWFDDDEVRYMVLEVFGGTRADISAMCTQLRQHFDFM